MKHLSETFNRDCVKAMKEYPDNYWDLAVCDPPYGIKRFEKPSGTTRFNSSKMMQETGLTWDTKPTKEYWDELFRVSKNQIVFGANNFEMPPSEYFLIWNKEQTVDNFASAEYAWVSMGLKKPAKIFTYSIHKHNQINKLHPTQKPIALYEWIFENYAITKQSIRCGNKHTREYNHLCNVCKTPFRVLDTHLGSQSSRIAAYKAGLDFTGFELDKEYFEQGNKRFNDFLTVYEQEVGKEKVLNGQARLF